MSFWKRQETYGAPAPTEVRTIGVPPMGELLSLGWQEKVLTEENPRTGAVTVKTVDYRLLVHHRHRGDFYIQWGSEHGPIEPM